MNKSFALAALLALVSLNQVSSANVVEPRILRMGMMKKSGNLNNGGGKSKGKGKGKSEEEVAAPMVTYVLGPPNTAERPPDGSLPSNNQEVTVQAFCPMGFTATGGGFTTDDEQAEFDIAFDRPIIVGGMPVGWEVRVEKKDNTGAPIPQAFAMCISGIQFMAPTMM